MVDLAWDRALVTGASGGIGAAIARLLAQRGTALTLVGQNTDRLAEVIADVEREVDTETIVADLSGPGLPIVEERLRSTDRPVDLLVNCAGYTLPGPFMESSLDDALGLMNVNMTALVCLTHAAAGAMAERGGGTILNISSRAAFGSRPGAAIYGASKAFVNVFSRAITAELAPRGVRVACVSPGATSTTFFERAGLDPALFQGVLWQSAEEVAEVSLAAAAAGDAMVLTSEGNASEIEAWTRAEWDEIVVRSPSPQVGA